MVQCTSAKNYENWLTAEKVTATIKWSRFLDSEGGSKNATPDVLVLVICSLKIPKAFLISSGAQRDFAHVHADTAHRSTISDFSLIF